MGRQRQNPAQNRVNSAALGQRQQQASCRRNLDSPTHPRHDPKVGFGRGRWGQPNGGRDVRNRLRPSTIPVTDLVYFTLGRQPNAIRGASNSARFGWRATRHQADGLQRSPRVGTASPRASRCSARNLIGHCFVRPRRCGPPVLRQSARRSWSGSKLSRGVCGAARCGRVAGHHVAQHEPAGRLPTRRSVAACPTPHSSGRPEGRRLARTLGR